MANRGITPGVTTTTVNASPAAIGAQPVAPTVTVTQTVETHAAAAERVEKVGVEVEQTPASPEVI